MLSMAEENLQIIAACCMYLKKMKSLIRQCAGQYHNIRHEWWLRLSHRIQFCKLTYYLQTQSLIGPRGSYQRHGTETQAFCQIRQEHWAAQHLAELRSLEEVKPWSHISERLRRLKAIKRALNFIFQSRSPKTLSLKSDPVFCSSDLVNRLLLSSTTDCSAIFFVCMKHCSVPWWIVRTPTCIVNTSAKLECFKKTMRETKTTPATEKQSKTCYICNSQGTNCNAFGMKKHIKSHIIWIIASDLQLKSFDSNRFKTKN